LGEVINPIPQEKCIVAKTNGIINLSITFLPINKLPIINAQKYIKSGVIKSGLIIIEKNTDNVLVATANGGAK
jgi:hypothetical protein